MGSFGKRAGGKRTIISGSSKMRPVRVLASVFMVLTMQIKFTLTLKSLNWDCRGNFENEQATLLSVMEEPEDLQNIYFENCDLTRFDFGILSQFLNLKFLEIKGGSLIEFTGMPSLPNLEIVRIDNSKFRRWYEPRLTPKILSITLKNITDDAVMDGIVDSLLFYKNALHTLKITHTNLTRIPPKVNQLSKLTTFIYRDNPQTTSLKAGTFPPTFKPETLLITDNNITTIEAGTFEGNFSGNFISLFGSHLPSLDENVFGPILRSMDSGKSGQISFGRITKCDCSMAWLHRDNPSFLQYITRGRCIQSFSESFFKFGHFKDLKLLDPTVFSCCPDNCPDLVNPER